MKGPDVDGHAIARWSLIGAAIPVLAWTLLVCGIAALAVQGIRSGRRARRAGDRFRWWTVRVPAAVAASAALVLAARWLIESVLRPFPDHLSPVIYLWSAAAVLAVLLVIVRARRHHAGVGIGRVSAAAAVSVLAVIAVGTATAAQINLQFAAYPTLGSLIGVHDYHVVDFAQVSAPAAQTVPATPLPPGWAPVTALPATGTIASAAIPGVQSHFAARDAMIYLPPAYFTDPRPLLPTVVLIAGQPGTPADLFNKAMLATTADQYAAVHQGLAPVIVVADPIGSSFNNTGCVDSPAGNAQTYLTEDVPAWIRTHLQVADGPRTLAIGGLSFGGTCALQLALAAPQTYSVFLDMSGQRAPTLGTEQLTVQKLFGGDEAAYRRHNPLDQLAAQSYFGLTGAFVVGSADPTVRAGLEDLDKAARAAGITTTFTQLPGGHSYAVWTAGLRETLPWLAETMGMTP